MKTKELTIPPELMGDWKTNKVVIKRLTFGENMRIRDQATNMKVGESGITGSVSQEIAAVAKIAKSVTEAPWKTGDNKTVADLDDAIGQWLLTEIAELSKLDTKKKATSDTQLKEVDSA